MRIFRLGDKKINTKLSKGFKHFSSAKKSIHKIKVPDFFVKYKLYWFSGLALIPIALLVWCFSQPWVVRAYFPNDETYPKATVLGKQLGNLKTDKLENQILEIKKDFESEKVAIINGSDQWDFEMKQLGVTFDDKATTRAVLDLNKISFADKYKLVTGTITSNIKPVLLLDKDICAKSLGAINIPEVKASIASFYFDSGIKIKSDESGSRYNVGRTCEEVSSSLETNLKVINASIDSVSADLVKADLETISSEVSSMFSEPMTFEKGNYKKTLIPQDILNMLDISKDSSGVHVNWITGKVDDLVKNIAKDVNVHNGSPLIGTCQRVIGTGGALLDENATKKIFSDLKAGSSHTYSLPIINSAASIKNITPVSGGDKVIYLTFDDGMTYAGKIMDYAACYGIKVTFFEIGTRAEADAPALKRAIAEGHAVQSHGFEHAIFDYGTRSYDWQVNDIKKSIEVIEGITGVRPTYFRPPGGNKTAQTYQAADANKIKLVLWTDASRDAAPSGVTSEVTCNYVLAGAFSGATVLMHSTNQSTSEAIPCIVEGLASKGYSMQAFR